MEGSDLPHRRSGFDSIVVPHVVVVEKHAFHLQILTRQTTREKTAGHNVVRAIFATRNHVTNLSMKTSFMRNHHADGEQVISVRHPWGGHWGWPQTCFFPHFQV